MFSERLAQIHGISYTKHHVSGEIPVAKMNFTSIAIAMGSERDLGLVIKIQKNVDTNSVFLI